MANYKQKKKKKLK